MEDSSLDLDAPEPFGGRARRFAEECERFERIWGIALAQEVDAVVSADHLHGIANGEVDIVDGLRANDLWSVLLSLNIDLRYVLWNRR